MSVLQCDRRGCEEIMCRTLIRNNYLCEDCLEEFEEFSGQENKSEKEWMTLFTAFLKTEKLGSNKIMTKREFFKS